MSNTKLRLHDKTAIVTGASSGIGRAAGIWALAIARQGARLVVCADLKPEPSSWDTGKPTHDEICAELGEDRAMFVACDVALSESVSASHATLEHVVAETVKKTGRLDIIVNNAGILVDGPLHEVSEDDWNKSMNVDAGGSFRGCKYAIAQFLKQSEDEDGQRGCIINMSSPSATHGTYGCAPHCASQAAIAGLTRAAAVEYSAMGIRVNALCPGYTETAMIEDCLANEQLRSRFLSSIPQRRFGRPSDVAGAVVWLACGAESAYVNGSSIYVDGAFSVL